MVREMFFLGLWYQGHNQMFMILHLKIYSFSDELVLSLLEQLQLEQLQQVKIMDFWFLNQQDPRLLFLVKYLYRVVLNKIFYV